MTNGTFIALFQESELEQRREEERMEAFRRQIIEEERQRLLQEHATRLLGYLPKVGTCCANEYLKW